MVSEPLFWIYLAGEEADAASDDEPGLHETRRQVKKRKIKTGRFIATNYSRKKNIQKEWGLKSASPLQMVASIPINLIFALIFDIRVRICFLIKSAHDRFFDRYFCRTK